MKISEEKLDQLVFTFMISSGPDVLVCFDQAKEEFYASFHRKNNPNDIELYRYTVFSDISTDRKILTQRVRNIIEDFISPRDLRDKKIDDVLD